MAVKTEQFEIVNLLIEKSDANTVREALLIAIYHGDNLIAKMIINHPQYKMLNDKKFMNATTDSFWQPQSENSQFSPDITPIMLGIYKFIFRKLINFLNKNFISCTIQSN